ncbi:MAG: hypothetical protein KJ043_06300, partial [Anaerolineae bacterium]|nr:hypothetical protein [Anaerolineae bacterium]
MSNQKQNPNEEKSVPQRWSADSSRKIIYRIVAKGTLRLTSAAHFGNGNTRTEERKDNNAKPGETYTVMELLSDPIHGTPILPGATIAGGLRHYLTQRTIGYRPEKPTDADKEFIYHLFGDALDDAKQTGNQSRLIIHDAYAQYGRKSTRDGVVINRKTRTAEDKKLFKLDVWEAGAQFEVCIELVLYEDDDLATYKEAFATLLKALQDGEIPMGGRKNRGYGQCVVDNWAVYEYDLHTIDGFLRWVNKDFSDATITSQFVADNACYIDKRRRVTLSATFALCDSLMIRKYPPKKDDPNDQQDPTRHLTDAFNNPLLTGTSIAGALRARAEKILNTIGKPITIIYNLFGDDGKDENDKKVRDIKTSRLIVKEAIIQNGNMNYIQNRVKIDRFTGGAYNTGLINQQPVFAKNDTTVTIELELRKPLDEEIGLLLLLLKDLSTEDLPLGGESSIGRGRLRGKCATITIEGKPYQLTDINGSVI